MDGHECPVSARAVLETDAGTSYVGQSSSLTAAPWRTEPIGQGENFADSELCFPALGTEREFCGCGDGAVTRTDAVCTGNGDFREIGPLACYARRGKGSQIRYRDVQWALWQADGINLQVSQKEIHRGDTPGVFVRLFQPRHVPSVSMVFTGGHLEDVS